MNSEANRTDFSFKGTIFQIYRSNPAALWIIAAALIILIVFTLSRTRNTTNTRSRVITAERLVHTGSMAHLTPNDTTPFPLSIDAVKIGDKIYSSKPPVYPFIMAGEAWVVHWITGTNVYTSNKSYIRIWTILNQVIPYILMMLGFLTIIWHYTQDKWTVNFLLLALSIGALPFGYAVTINNHTPAAILFFGAFYFLWLIIYRKQEKIKYYILTGLLAGLGVSFDLPGLAILGVMLLFLFWHNPKFTVIAILIAFIPIGLTLLSNYMLTGTVKPIYMQGELYRFEGSYWTQPEANDTFREPKWQYLFHILFGHHGLFLLTPALILGFVGWIKTIISRKYDFWPAIAGLSFSLLAIFLFILLRSRNYGGYCIGMRWFVLFMPLLVFTSMPIVLKLGKTIYGKTAALILLGLSIPIVIQSLYWESFIRSFVEIWFLGP